MTRIGRRLIEDFLLPSLDDRRYGDRLQWVDKQNLCFSIRWSHKNAAKWTLEDTVVFQDWDKLKGHFHPEIKGYYMQAKQRFRAALYKLHTVRKICSEDKHTKVYQLVLTNEKKKMGDVTVMSPMLGKIGMCIPTSVICRNVNYVPSEHQNYELRTESVLEEGDVHNSSSNSSGYSSPVIMSEEASKDLNMEDVNNIGCNDVKTKEMEQQNFKIVASDFAKNIPLRSHIPVQALPERPFNYVRNEWSLKKNFSEKGKEEPMNLSLKRPMQIPVSAR